MKNPFDQQKTLSGIKHIVALGSGKGGVGKSTLAVNTAFALKKLNLKVGLMDADLYGPSVPAMTGTLRQKMIVENNKLIPILKYGVKISSIGYLIDDSSAVIWRGPMLFKAVEQFLSDVQWGDLDYLIVDLPPGTGDVALTLAQKTPLSGGIIACTPQNLVLADAKRAVDMFREIQIPLLGFVENMSHFQLGNSNEPLELFPKGQLDTYLKEKNIEKLVQIPFHPGVALCAESGVPSIEDSSESPAGQAFMTLAEKIHNKLQRPRSSVG